MTESFDSRAFRAALGGYATGVAVITTRSPKGVAAITVNSFASVSLSPPLVHWSIGDQSEAFATFGRAESWGVSVLAAAQEEIARRFAQSGRSSAEDDMHEELGGAPVLRGAVSRFGCRTFQRRTLGDHLLIVGEVLGFDAGAGAVLSFHRGRFGVVE